MPFEVFDKRVATSSKTPMVTIQSGGQFSFNQAAFEAMDKPEAVELLYDSKERLIGFRPAPDANPRSYPLKRLGKDSPGRQVSGRAFTKYYELDTTTARRYTVEMQDGILVLNLNSESTVVTGPRSAMKSRLGEQ